MTLGLDRSLLEQTLYQLVPPETERWGGMTREEAKDLISAIADTIARNNAVIETQLRDAGVPV